MYWDHMTGWGWGMMFLWSAIWIGFLAAVVWAAVEYGRRRRSGARPTLPPRPARDLLDERLARGEIDPDEYHQRREALEHHTRAGV